MRGNGYMKKMIGVCFTACLLLPSVAHGTRVFESLEERLKKADVVIAGTLSDVRRSFSIVFEDPKAMGGDRWNFSVGLIEIEDVLMGKLPSGARVTSFAFWAGSTREGRPVVISMPPPLFHEGDRGIWILRRGIFIGHYGADYDCFLPLESAAEVKNAIANIQKQSR